MEITVRRDFLRLSHWISAMVILLLAGLPPSLAADSPIPVIHCDTPNPTRDKPQNKLWYAKGTWWAWLPQGAKGSRIWRKDTRGGWRSLEHLENRLDSLPGRADVWCEGESVAAVLMQDSLLTAVLLRWDDSRNTYEIQKVLPVWREAASPETATLDRDSQGNFWIAYPLDQPDGRAVVVRKIPPDFSSPGEKIFLARGLYEDEICAVTSYDGGAGVMWSDQNHEMVLFSRHESGALDTLWQPADTVSRGHKTADDHINFCRPPASRGPRLIAATKTSLDSMGQPLLSLRVNTDRRVWISVPFARLTRRSQPSRPIVFWLKNRPMVVYTAYGSRGSHQSLNSIMLQPFSADALDPAGQARELIPPVEGLNDVTGPKSTPQGVPLFLLASDAGGAVYEASVK